MNPEQARNLVRQTLTQSFDKAKFRTFVLELLNEFDESKAFTSNKTYIKDAFKNHVDRFERLGTYASVDDLKDRYGFEYLRRNVRLCGELGADVIKTNWPGDQASFGKLVAAANGIPIVLAGGSRLRDEELLGRMEAAMAEGAIGCSVGRNIFMHRSPEAITRALSRVIRERWSAAKALDELARDLGTVAAR